MIPLRPELIEFMSAESLGRFTRCSKTLRTHLREMNAWRLLAGVRCPPRTTRDALEQDAISRMRAQALRRRLAADLSRSAPSAPRSDRRDQIRNKFTDFTYFVRIEEGDKLIWEGDLSASEPGSDDEFLELHPSHLFLARMDSWEGMVDYLSKVPVDDNHDDSFLERLKISVVAVREADSAMIALGCFTFDEPVGTVGDARQPYFFKSQSRLCSLRASAASEFHYKPYLSLELVHDSDGGGYLNWIKLYMEIYSNFSHMMMDRARVHDFQLLLTHLAGVHHLDREALRTRLVRRAQSAMDLAGSDGSRSE